MKQIALLICMGLLFQACQSGSDANSSGANQLESQEQANDFIQIEEGPVYSFTVVPDQYQSCKAVFAQSEDELATGNFILASDLENSCVLAIDGRIVQVDIRSRQISNPDVKFYKFEGEGYRIDLELRQTELVGQNLQKVRGKLRIFSDSGFRDIYYIMGEVDC